MPVTYDFRQTRDEIIARAFRILGELPDGSGVSLTTDQTNHGATALNAMVKRWQNDHVFLWTTTILTKTYSSGTSTIVDTTDPILSVDQAYVYDTTTKLETPIDVISDTEFNEITDKESTGMPLAAAWQASSNTGGTLRLYPKADKDYTIKLYVTQRLADFDASGDYPDLPSNWIDALTYGLAAMLCDEYPVPLQERQWIVQRAQAYFNTAKGYDAPKTSGLMLKGAYSYR